MAVDHPSSSRLADLRFDVVAAVVGLLVAIALFPLRFLSGQIFIVTIPVILGAACLLYLYGVYRDEHREAFSTFPPAVTFALPSVVVTGMALLVLTVVLQGTRSMAFHSGAVVIGSLILLQILFAHDDDLVVPLLLVQIVVFAFVLRFTALYVTPGFIGVDIWTHIVDLAEPIAAEGSLAAIAHDKHYTSPFYHLLVVAAAGLYDVSLRSGLYLSLGLAMPFSILLVYVTTALLVPARWAVLAAALFGMADYVVHWGIHLIPTSLGFVFFLGVLYYLVRIMRIEFSRRDFASLVVLSVGVVFTHQLTTLIMLTVFCAALVGQLTFKYGPYGFQRLQPDVFRAHRPVNMVGLVVFNFGLTIFMWSLTPFRQDTFLATVLNWFQETIVEETGFLNLARPGDADANGGEATAAAPTLVDQIVQYVDVIGFLLLLGFTFAGCLYVVQRDRSQQSALTLLIATAVMLVFVMGLPIVGIHNFVPTRWYAFMYAPMAMLTVVGLRYFVHHLDGTTVLVCLLLLALVYPAGMLLAAPTTADNPVFPSHNERLAYDEPELAAVSTIEAMTGGPSGSELRPDQVLFTDHPYHTVFSRTNAHSAAPATVEPGEPVEHDVTVYRSAQSTDATFFRDAAGMGQLRNVEADRICRPDQAVVYTNGDVTMCGASPAMS